MSKSYQNTIPIFLARRDDRQAGLEDLLCVGIKTDSKGVDDPKDPNDALMTLYRLLDSAKAEEFAPIYTRGGVGYGDLKKRLHEAYNERFGPLRERRQHIAADEAYVEGVLEEGGKRARAVAREVDGRRPRRRGDRRRPGDTRLSASRPRPWFGRTMRN